MANSMPSYDDRSSFADPIANMTTVAFGTQQSVLETPPVMDPTEASVFANLISSSDLMANGPFSGLPLFEPLPAHPSTGISSIFSFGAHSEANEFVADQVHVSTSPTQPSVEDFSVQSFVNDPSHICFQMEDGTKREPLVNALSHDHAYTPSENDDYQILRDFLTLGNEIGVVDEMDDEELDLIASSVDIGQLAPSTSYLDTYGDLTALLNGEPQDDEQEPMAQQQQPVGYQQEPQMASLFQQQEPSVVSVSHQDESLQEDAWTFVPSTSQTPADSSPTTPMPETGRMSKRGSTAIASLVKDERYWDRRKKNNVASARSRQTRKEKAVQIELERLQLEAINLQLKKELAHLTRLVSEHKRRFFSVFKK